MGDWKRKWNKGKGSKGGKGGKGGKGKGGQKPSESESCQTNLDKFKHSQYEFDPWWSLYEYPKHALNIKCVSFFRIFHDLVCTLFNRLTCWPSSPWSDAQDKAGSFKRHKVGPIPQRAVLVTSRTPSQTQKANRNLVNRIRCWKLVDSLGFSVLMCAAFGTDTIQDSTSPTGQLDCVKSNRLASGEAIRLLQGVLDMAKVRLEPFCPFPSSFCHGEPPLREIWGHPSPFFQCQFLRRNKRSQNSSLHFDASPEILWPSRWSSCTCMPSKVLNDIEVTSVSGLL